MLLINDYSPTGSHCGRAGSGLYFFKIAVSDDALSNTLLTHLNNMTNLRTFIFIYWIENSRKTIFFLPTFLSKFFLKWCSSKRNYLIISDIKETAIFFCHEPAILVVSMTKKIFQKKVHQIVIGQLFVQK